ncbi:D-alanyl-D-alanine carboxypeptidase/D-alanyl-D-alanine endopeptidase [Arthrobacter cryoconiti]|uniref:D-alanyl-D-alanine carboxypeptidase/D-alanyl-D-alanine-endopeptidase n=1 Tax=Arthrobacter cryoconiti TaxID=748907 RepID=A0ABV8QY02_9MICC|nr:D-alanyl-D-alanine carboxypeptidase/D-alanyl-D-alanine-endopeptidase [Arthrobacter cryoconiti]MCC9067409.1 D-alanyl-D-alanine carboxypeptidase/D-alanyl-D-alanine-endopeptidase [Arthrobacter cryoconiti]
MGRTSRTVTSALLVLALAAITVPVGINLVPVLLANEPAVVSVLPAAQLAPTSLSAIQGISSVSPQAPLPDPAQLAKDLNTALAFDGGTFSAQVSDAITGQTLYSKDGEEPGIPASNLKLLTSAAALKSLGATTRMSTTVLAGTTPGSLVLRAGGDAMLAEGESKPSAVMGHAGLETLARETAVALAKTGTAGPVTLSIDDSLFSGPALNPGWDIEDVNAGEIAPIYPMALYAGRTAPNQPAPRPVDSGIAVATAFAAALEKAGVATTGTITRTSTATDNVLAKVESATVAAQVQYLLVESDNYLAEVMGRLVAVKEKQPGSAVGATKAVRSVLTGLGLSLDAVTMVDNCGLALGNLISAHDLVKTVSLLLASEGTDVGQAVAGLPIAGLNGTLNGRFASAPSLSAAGVVRAKTGTLRTVSALSGYVLNAQGRLLVFSIMGNNLTAGPASAIPTIDAAATVLAKS